VEALRRYVMVTRWLCKVATRCSFTEKRIAAKVGEEYFIPRGVPHSGEVATGCSNSKHSVTVA
jgi:hypothetical protein